MTRKVFSCVLIGLGDIGLNYDLHQDQDKYVQTHARAFFLNSGFDLKGGVDINADACNTFTKTYGIRSYTEIEAALLEIKPDLIILAIPTSFQLEAIKEIVKCYEPKVILCEKPMGVNLDHGKEIVSICRKKDISLYVNYIRRCLPESKEVKKRIDRSSIKFPIKCVIWYTKGIMHNGSHFINLMEYWFSECLDIKIIDKGREFKSFGSEPSVYLKFKNCEVTLIPVWEELYSHYTIELVSATGRLYWSHKNLEWTKVVSSENMKGYSYLAEKSEEISTEAEKYQMHVAEALYIAMSGQDSSISTGEQALETLHTIDSILSMD